jgi:TonB family protein
VDDLVASGLEDQRIAKAVQERGIDFEPTDEYLEELRSRGAKQAVLDALRAVNPTPLSKSELLHFLTAGKTSDSVQAMVERRGIDFKPTDEDLDTLRIAGATEGLMKVVREAGETFSVRGGVSAPICIYSPNPPYSDEARKARLSGTVVVQVIVDAAGKVRDARVVKPLGLGLDEKAVETIRTWRFKPAMRNGIPVNVRMLVQVAFSIPIGPPQGSTLSKPLPPGCKTPVAVASEGWDDPSKISWNQMPGDFIQWWFNKGGSRHFPSVCIVPSLNDGADYALYVQQRDYYSAGSSLQAFVVSVVKVVNSNPVWPPFYVTKTKGTGNDAMRDALKSLTSKAH